MVEISPLVQVYQRDRQVPVHADICMHTHDRLKLDTHYPCPWDVFTGHVHGL